MRAVILGLVTIAMATVAAGPSVAASSVTCQASAPLRTVVNGQPTGEATRVVTCGGHVYIDAAALGLALHSVVTWSVSNGKLYVQAASGGARPSLAASNAAVQALIAAATAKCTKTMAASAGPSEAGLGDPVAPFVANWGKPLGRTTAPNATTVLTLHFHKGTVDVYASFAGCPRVAQSIRYLFNAPASQSTLASIAGRSMPSDTKAVKTFQYISQPASLGRSARLAALLTGSDGYITMYAQIDTVPELDVLAGDVTGAAGPPMPQNGFQVAAR